MKEMKQRKRENKKNHRLFIQIVEYWTILAVASLLIWFIEHKYKLYLKRKQNQVVVDISDDNDNLELTPIRTYRRNSTDETDSELEEQEKKKYFSDKTKKRMGYVTHYLFFGGVYYWISILVFSTYCIELRPVIYFRS